MAAAAAAAAAAAEGSTSPTTKSPCVSFIEESLILPTRNAGLFAPAFLLISANTFVFLAAAYLRFHPLATSILVVVDVHAAGGAPSSTTVDPASHGRIREHAKDLVLVYLAYLASKLTAQVAAVLAASATCSGERPSSFAQLVRCRVAEGRVRGPFITAVFAAVLELASTALLVLAALSVTSWRRWYTGPGASSSASAQLLFGCGCVLCLLALLLRLCVGVVVPVSIAVSTAPGEEGCCYGARALWRAWRLMWTRRKEAAIQVVAASLLPVYALAFEFTEGNAFNHEPLMWVFGVLYGYVLPSAAVQLYSTVAATVFHHRCKHGIYIRKSLL